MKILILLLKTFSWILLILFIFFLMLAYASGHNVPIKTSSFFYSMIVSMILLLVVLFYVGRKINKEE